MNSDLQRFSARLVSGYASCVEEFLRKLGIDESNVHECEMRTYRTDPLTEHVYRGDAKIGEVSLRHETSNGYRMVIECVGVNQKEGGE